MTHPWVRPSTNGRLLSGGSVPKTMIFSHSGQVAHSSVEILRVCWIGTDNSSIGLKVEDLAGRFSGPCWRCPLQSRGSSLPPVWSVKKLYSPRASRSIPKFCAKVLVPKSRRCARVCAFGVNVSRHSLSLRREIQAKAYGILGINPLRASGFGRMCAVTGCVLLVISESVTDDEPTVAVMMRLRPRVGII